jgi:pimeloyl-ACP methyl ester carboxylesterase
MSRPPGLLVALVLLVVTADVPALEANARPAAAADTPKTTVRWRSCGRSFQCGAIRVPVDYSKPNGRRTKVVLARVRARDDKHRAGALVVNFGGPGDPGTVSLRGFVQELPREIRDRYDIVSFDPRGTGASHPIDCISDRAADTLMAVDPTPETDAQLREFYAGTFGGTDLIQSCIDEHGEWLARVGSRNVARDLDRIRGALGERTLHYLGYSYGTVIGAAYAQQFPSGSVAWCWTPRSISRRRPRQRPNTRAHPSRTRSMRSCAIARGGTAADSTATDGPASHSARSSASSRTG